MWRPKLVINSLRDLDITALCRQGIKVLAIDLDNTLVPYDVKKITPEIEDFLLSLQQQGLQIVLISNNTYRRVSAFVGEFPLIYFANSKKPLPFIYRKLLREFAVDRSEIACVGDQIFTDVIGANINGMFSILVSPLSSKDFIVTRISRCVERWLLKRMGVSR